MKPIPIPQSPDHRDYWEGTTGVRCHCGGTIEWAEAAYTPGTRACRSCLAMFSVRGNDHERRLHPQGRVEQGPGDVILDDVDDEDEVYRVPEDLYPGWYQPVDLGE